MHGIYYLLIEWNTHMSREFPSTSATNMIFEINQILPQQPVKQLQKAVFVHTQLNFFEVRLLCLNSLSASPTCWDCRGSGRRV